MKVSVVINGWRGRLKAFLQLLLLSLPASGEPAGTLAPFISGDGEFAKIVALATDGGGRLYVLDAGGTVGTQGKTVKPRVLVFAPDGRQVAELSIYDGKELGKRTPTGVAVSPEGGIFVADTAGPGAAPAGAGAEPGLEAEETETEEGLGTEAAGAKDILSPGRIVVFARITPAKYERKRAIENLGDSPSVRFVRSGQTDELFVLSQETVRKEKDGQEVEGKRHFVKVLRPDGEEVAEFEVGAFATWVVAPDRAVYGIEGELWHFYLRGTPTGKVEERFCAGGLVTRHLPPKWEGEEVVGTLGSPSAKLERTPSLAFDKGGHWSVMDGKCEEFDTDGVFVREYAAPLIPRESFEPSGLTFDGENNAYFFDAVTQNVYRLSAEQRKEAVQAARQPPEALCLGADARFEPHQFLEGGAEPQLRISVRRFFRRFPGLFLRFYLEDGLGNRLADPKPVDVLSAIKDSDKQVVEIRVPVKERRFGIVAANVELGWEKGILGSQQVGFSIIPRYPGFQDGEPGFIGAAHRMGLKCERGYPWPTWSAIQTRTGADFVRPPDQSALAEHANRLGIRLFFQLGPNEPPGDPAGFYENEDYEDYACQMTRWFDTLKHWELVNEPPAHAAPEWYVEAYLKPAYRGIKRADPTAQVLGLTTCGWHRGALERVLKCGGALYMDAEATHIFTPGYAAPEEAGIETVAAEDRAAMRRYGLGEMPIWLTETQWRLRHTKMAEDVVRCYLYCDGLGIPKEQIYYFMAHTTGFGPDWGLCGPLFPPLYGAGMRSMALGLRVLGRLTNDKKLARRESWLPWLRTYLYENERERVYVVYSYDFRTDVTLGTDEKAVRSVDFYGNERQIEPEAGKFSLRVSGYPAYLVVPAGKRVWLWDAHEFGPNVALATMGTTATASDEKHEAFGPEQPPEGAIDGRIHREWDNFLGWVNAEPEKSPDWLVLEFPQERVIRRVNIYAHSQNSGCPSIKDHELFYEKDGGWVSAGRHSKYEFLFAFSHELPDVRTRRLKLAVYEVMVWGANWTQIYEVEAYGPWGHDIGMEILPDWTHYDVFLAGQERDIAVRLKSCLPKACSGAVQVLLPDGGEVVGDAEKAFNIDSDASVDLTFRIKPKPDKEGPFRIAAKLSAKGGEFAGFTGHRTVTVKNEAPKDWLPEIKVGDPKPDPGDYLLRENAKNLWSRCDLSEATISDDNQVRLAWLKKPENLVRTGPQTTPASLYDGDPKTVWSTKGRFFDRYVDARGRKQQQRQSTAGAGAEVEEKERKDAGAGLAGDDEQVDDLVRQETQTIEWSLAEEMQVAYVRTQFADGVRGKYALLLAAAESPDPKDWIEVAAGKIDAPVVVTELQRPVRARRSRIVLSDMEIPPGDKEAASRPVIDQVVSAPPRAVCDLGGEQSVGMAEAQFPENVACEYELFATAQANPPASLQDPAWHKIGAARRGFGKDTVLIEPPVTARFLATRLILAEPVGGLFKGGDYEYAGVDGFGRPLYPVGVPAGQGGARFERRDAFSGAQSLCILPGGSMVCKSMPCRGGFAGGIGLIERAERYLLAFYAKGAPMAWTVRMSSVQHTKTEPVDEQKLLVPGSKSWRSHRFSIDLTEAKTNLLEIEAAVEADKTGGEPGPGAWIDDVSLVPGFTVPLAGELVAEQRVLSPHEHHAEGSVTSEPFEIGTRPKTMVARWDGETPENTGIAVQVRAGRRLEDGQFEWREWSAPLPRGEASPVSPGDGSFAQVCAKLTSTAARRTPTLRTLHLAYEGSSVPLGTLYRGGPTPKLMELRRNIEKYRQMRRESAWAQFEIGRLYGVLGHVEQAALELDRVIGEYADIPPWAATALFEKAELLRHAGQRDRALEAYRACVEKFGKFDNCLYPVLKSKASVQFLGYDK